MKAKVKSSGRPPKKASRKAPHAMVNIKASHAWRAWLGRLAIHFRTDVSKIIDAAVAEYAASRDFTEEPPLR